MFKLVLTLSAIYLAIIGLALVFAPLQFGIGAVPQDASPVPSTARNAVILANLVGFGAVAANDVWGMFTGEAHEIAQVILAVHLLFTAAFVVTAGRLQG